jgi:hypothetical protein
MLLEEERKRFFFGKKEAKNFHLLRALAAPAPQSSWPGLTRPSTPLPPAAPTPTVNKSFFASFFSKKEVLPSFTESFP